MGLILMGVAGLEARHPYVIFTTWIPGDAVVLTKPEIIGAGNKYAYVQFTFRYVVGGTSYKKNAGIPTAQVAVNNRAIQPGTHHRIRYDPALPSSVEYEPGLRLFALPLVLFGMGSCFFLGGVLSDYAARGKPRNVSSVFNLNAPPRGAWFIPLPGGFTAGAVTRKSVGALMSAAFALTLFGMALATYPQGVTIFIVFGAMCLFLTVYLAAGRIRLMLDRDRLTIFTGIGRIGFGTTYQWSSFRSLREEGTERNETLRIVLEGTQRAEFGENLSDERREFLVNVLRARLPAQGTEAAPATLATFELAGESIKRTCSNCGGLLPAGAHFCTVCGKQADAVPVPLDTGSL